MPSPFDCGVEEVGDGNSRCNGCAEGNGIGQLWWQQQRLRQLLQQRRQGQQRWQGQQGGLSPMPLPLLSSSLPLLLWQPSSLLLPPPQSPNAIALSAAIAVAVAITHLFDTAIKPQWHGCWQQKRWLRQQGWRASNGDNGDGDQWQWQQGGGQQRGQWLVQQEQWRWQQRGQWLEQQGRW